MHIGVTTDLTADARPVVDLARPVEAAGLESLFVTEHSHVPVSQRELLDDEFHATDHALFDPFVALGAVAAATTTLRLGTGICQVPLHDPILLANQVATVDVISGGRFIFGVGPGWLEDEIRNHGVEPADRWRVMGERVHAMHRMWSAAEPEFHGEHVAFDPILIEPKPVQRPWPPVLVAGPGSRAIDRVVAYGDGWFPVVETRADLEPWVSKLATRGEAAGRTGLTVTAGLLGLDLPLIEACAELGVERCAVWLPPADLATTTSMLAGYAAAAARFR